MRLTALFLILIATLLGSGYWYRALSGVCNVPIEYRIGNIDSRFNTDKEELKRIALSAEALWEEKIGADLFTFSEEGKLPIHLVFDDRQESSEVEEELREDLEAKEGMSEEFSRQYDALITEFRKLKKDYEARIVSYESKLGSYNRTVSECNSKGGAPEETMSELKETERELVVEQRNLEALADKLNTLVSQLNALGAKANTLIKNYNTVVEEYNDRVAEKGEFTQGDFTGDAIHVYQFNSEEELTLVLAHEFGHALSLGHVENEKSIMYHFMKAQSTEEGITAEDSGEYTRICEEGTSPWSWIKALQGSL